MQIENLSGNPAGLACAAFVENSMISTYDGYEYITEYERELCDDEIADGYQGFYTVVTVKNIETSKECIGHVKCIDGYPSVCTLVESTEQ